MVHIIQYLEPVRLSLKKYSIFGNSQDNFYLNSAAGISAVMSNATEKIVALLTWFMPDIYPMTIDLLECETKHK